MRLPLLLTLSLLPWGEGDGVEREVHLHVHELEDSSDIHEQDAEPVEETLGKIQSISSRILARTHRRRQRLLGSTDKSSDVENTVNLANFPGNVENSVSNIHNISERILDRTQKRRRVLKARQRIKSKEMPKNPQKSRKPKDETSLSQLEANATTDLVLVGPTSLSAELLLQPVLKPEPDPSPVSSNFLPMSDPGPDPSPSLAVSGLPSTSEEDTIASLLAGSIQLTTPSTSEDEVDHSDLSSDEAEGSGVGQEIELQLNSAIGNLNGALEELKGAIEQEIEATNVNREVNTSVNGFTHSNDNVEEELNHVNVDSDEDLLAMIDAINKNNGLIEPAKTQSNIKESESDEKGSGKLDSDGATVDNALVISQTDNKGVTTSNQSSTAFNMLSNQTTNMNSDCSEKTTDPTTLVQSSKLKENTTKDANEFNLHFNFLEQETTTKLPEDITTISDLDLGLQLKGAIGDLNGALEELRGAIEEASDSESEASDSESEASGENVETTTESSTEVTTSIEVVVMSEDLLGLKLEGVTLSGRDKRIMLTLMELEELRGEQVDMKEEIQAKLTELEDLLVEEETNEVLEGTSGIQKPRSGKTLPPGFVEGAGAVAAAIPGIIVAKVEGATTTFHLFDNLQRQISSLLQNRLQFLEVISSTIQQEIKVFKQTIEFLQRLVNFKLDQSELLLGKMNPITDILQSGATSVFLLVSRFFEGVEAVVALKGEFLRAFTGDPTQSQEVNLLERIQQLQLQTILPRKIRLLLNIHARSDEIGAMVSEIFNCVAELLTAKQDLIKAVGTFVDTQVSFLSGLTGPALTIPTIIEAVRSGKLYTLLNFGPEKIIGLPQLSAGQVESLVSQMLSGLGPGPSVPVLGEVKPLLVDARLLGTLAGPQKNRLVNRFLARKLSAFISGTKSVFSVDQGEILLRNRLPPVSLGTPCSNEVHLGTSYSSVTVARASRFSATAGLTLNSHAPPTSDLFGHANLLVNLDMTSSFSSSLGRHLFGRCITKLSATTPMRVRGKAYGHAYAKVVVTGVRLEVRPTEPAPVIGNFLNVKLGVDRPHLVFTFNIKLDGTLHKFDIQKLQLKGCEFKILGIKMFSNCDLVENFIRKQISKATRNTFPLRPSSIFRDIEQAVQMRLGEEVAIPLVLQDGANLEPANRVISKTQKLIQLNIQLFHSLTSLTKDMVEAEEERNGQSRVPRLLESRF